MLTSVAFAAVFPVRAEVTLYQNVFEGEMVYDGEASFECHAYGPWGTPTLRFSIMCFMNGSTHTTMLTAKESDLLPITPLYPPQPSYSEAFDPRAAWIVVPTIGKYVSVSNTVYSESVFKDESTGWYIPEVPYTFTGGVDETKTLYMCYGHPNRTTVGWVKICICGDCAWIEGSCIAMGVYSLRAGRPKYTEWPIDTRTFLNGGIRKLDIFVDASAAAGGTGLSWESPFRDVRSAGRDAGSRRGGGDIGCFEFVPTVYDTNATHGVTVPPEWLEAHYGLDRGVSPDAAYQAATVAETANPRGGGGTLSAWESYLWDLDPADSNQMARAEIAMVGGAAQVQVAPRSADRVYTLLGKASLDASEWARSGDFSDADFLRTNRFFKVSVEAR